jgi:hypothetical protein
LKESHIAFLVVSLLTLLQTLITTLLLVHKATLLLGLWWDDWPCTRLS